VAIRPTARATSGFAAPRERVVEGDVGKVAKAPKGNTLTLAVGRGNEEKDFTVAKDAKVTVEGKESKLEDVKEGMVVTLVLDAEQKTVKEVSVAPARKRERESYEARLPCRHPADAA
jgi:hypothetical protein